MRSTSHRMTVFTAGLVAGLAMSGCAVTQTAPQSGTPRSAGHGMASMSPAAGYGDAHAPEVLVRAIDERLSVMPDVAAAKWVSGAPVVDTAREAVVLEQVATRAAALGLDAATVRAFFDEQIRLARLVQLRWHDTWKMTGHCQPCAAPSDLQVVRARIDAANEQQLAALHLLAPLAAAARDSTAAQLAPVVARHGLQQDEVQVLVTGAAAVERSKPRPVLEQVRAAGVLRIGTTGDYAPFSLATGASLAGADIEMARALARHLGVEPAFVRTSWPTLLDDLRQDRFDVALSGISYTDDRAALGFYSSAYHQGGKTLLARCSEGDRFDTPAELDRPGVRVIVNPGGTNERYVREFVHVAEVIVHPDNRTVAAEIAAGHADVMVTDDVEAELQARRRPGTLCRTYPGLLTRSEKRILMQRDPALQAAVDAWLAGVVAEALPARALERAMQDYATGGDAP